MGKDMGWKEYFSDNRRYADLINGLGCEGEQLVTEDDLQELDTQTGFFRMRGENADADCGHARELLPAGAPVKRGRSGIRRKRGKGRPRIRDMVRKAAFGVNFVVIGIENQELIDYSMVLRNMSYDVGEYEKQAARLRSLVRRRDKRVSAGEYLYGFPKDGRLHPVVTLILYSGADEWDGPKSLHGMLDFTDIPHRLKRMVQDYRINLIEIRKLTDTSVFRTDLRQVFDFIRCAEDKAALAELVQRDLYYQAMEEDAYNVVVQYAHADELLKRKEYYRKDGKVDMCTAIREMMEESRALGLTEGRSQGIDEKTRRIVCNMITRGMTDDDIMAIAECGPELIREMRSSGYRNH